MTEHPLLLTPLRIRELELRNRIVISPMCTYSAEDGMMNDWHLAHLGQFAIGGAGLVFCEASAVEERGRITHGDVGIWKDEQIAPIKRVFDFVKAHGARTAIQIAHAGRKASMQRPWFGSGPLDDTDRARGDLPWEIVGASPIPVDEGWLLPRELASDEIPALIEQWVAAARRALATGADVLEIHGAHGYLLASFLSPISNRRRDRYGGDRAGRMRLPLEISEAVRAVWPDDKPLFFRISAVDGAENGWNLDDSVVLARELKALGVDVVDCSSGGISGAATAAGVKRQPGYQVPYAERIRKDADLITQAVGLITHPLQAEEILREQRADLIAIAREALNNPHWALHAAAALGADPEFEDWPTQYGWWLVRRERSSVFYQPPGEQAAAE
ncbi:MAG: NADH:flavin oxidoreductase/NADH oxidase [Gammaproteobacteria bacterium]|nr:MAG: NADH:flavin oxidoreductase/NADH oxidase [Gammaproteobacteria bacterium]